VLRVVDAELDRGLPVEGADLSEDHLHRIVVVLALEPEARPAVAVLVVGSPPGQRSRLLTNVTLGVALSTPSVKSSINSRA
jgi:hypothetical protein